MKARRLLAFFLSLLLLLASGSFVIPAFAASRSRELLSAGSGTIDLGVRFIFEVLNDGENDLLPDADTGFSLSIAEGAAYSAQNFAPLAVAGGSNTVYIALINHSNATELTISYEYDAYTPEVSTLKKSMQPLNEQMQVICFHTPYIESAKSFTLTTNGTVGTLEISSLFNISMHNPSIEETVSVDTCLYAEATKTLEISGTMDWKTTVLYSDATLALFTVDASSSDIYLFDKVPLARTGIANTFSFSVSLDSENDLYYRYVIAVITKSGERIPLTTPYYPTVVRTRPLDETGFKGLSGGVFEDVISTGTATASVDVYLDRMIGSSNDGILYAGDHSYYYFDSQYVEGIDRAVQNLSAAGKRVYLRFLVSSDANNLPFVSYTAQSTDLLWKGIYIRNDEALHMIYALTDFITARYSTDQIGKISGLILGQTVNLASACYRTDAKNLAEATENYAAAFALIGGVACRNIKDLAMTVSLSGDVLGNALDTEELSSKYPADLYLRSFLDVLKEDFLTPPAVNLLIETDQIPLYEEGEYISALPFEPLENATIILSDLHKVYSALCTRVAYSWMPAASLSATELQQAYTRLFLEMKLSDRVFAFFLNLSHLSAAQSAKIMGDLSYLMTYIDTDRHEDVIAPFLDKMGITDLSTPFPTYKSADFKDLYYDQLAMKTGGYGGAVPTGSLDLWNFAKSTNTEGWYQGYGCEEISIHSENNGNLLAAKISFASGFVGMSHRFRYGEELNQAPLLKFTLGAEGRAGAQYEVQMQLIGSDAYICGTAILTAGEIDTYYLDLSSVAASLKNISTIRFFLRPLQRDDENGRLLLRSITIESTELDDDELKDLVRASSAREAEDEDIGKKNIRIPLLVSLMLVLISAAGVAFTIVYSKNKKRD